MRLEQLFALFVEARKLSKHSEFVVIGSNAILALAQHARIPQEMAMSIDVDSYLKADPARVFELKAALGENSAFHVGHGIYLDPVAPELPTLPEGWQPRMSALEQAGVRIWFLDPNDTAISKYARGEKRDRRWIRAGLRAGLLSLPIILQRVSRTEFLDDEEQQRALKLIEQDRAWLASPGKRL
jgi:hypothetical protein